MATLTCDEIFDVDNLRSLSSHNGVSKEQKTKLRAYKKLARDGNKVFIQYDFGKNWNKLKVGDYYAVKGIGLAAFDKDIRACLAQKYYWDVDIVNAHPSIIQNHCRELGLDCPVLDKFIAQRSEILKAICDEHKRERWWAKEECIKVFNGGYSMVHPILLELIPEIKKIRKEVVNRNPEVFKVALAINNNERKQAKVTTLSIVFQDKTRQLLSEIVDFLQTKGRSLDVRIHDGGLVRKLPNEESFPEELLRETEAHILTKLKYNISLEVKPLIHSFEFNPFTADFAQYTNNPEIYDDNGVAKVFVELMGDDIKIKDGEVYYFDKDTGLWTNNDSAFLTAVNTHRYKLNWFYYNALNVRCIINYGGNFKNINNMKKFVFTHVKKDNFFESKHDSSIGKLLFSDGIYDFNTNTFTEGFDPSIVFFKNIKRPFPKQRNEKLIAEIDNILFKDAFNESTYDSGIYLRKTLAMAIYGDYRRKVFNVLIGDSDCGKGIITSALSGAFDKYVGFWSSSELTSKDRSGMDVARKNTWLLDLYGCRIGISSELKYESVIDADIVKRASSGGDVLVGRHSYGSEINFINTAMLFMLVNDFNSFSSKTDSGIASRSSFCRYENVFKPNPEPNTNQRQARPELKSLFETNDEYKDSVFWLLADTYQSMNNEEKKIGGKITPPASILDEVKEWIPDENADIKAVLEDNYDLTKNEDDNVPFKDISALFKRHKYNMSDTKLGRVLKSLGLVDKVMKINGKAYRCRTGLRVKTLTE